MLTPHVAPARAAQRPEAVAAGRLLLTACLINSLSRRITQYGSKSPHTGRTPVAGVPLDEQAPPASTHELAGALFCAYGISCLW